MSQGGYWEQVVHRRVFWPTLRQYRWYLFAAAVESRPSVRGGCDEYAREAKLGLGHSLLVYWTANWMQRQRNDEHGGSRQRGRCVGRWPNDDEHCRGRSGQGRQHLDWDGWRHQLRYRHRRVPTRSRGNERVRAMRLLRWAFTLHRPRGCELHMQWREILLPLAPLPVRTDSGRRRSSESSLS